jgi:hypothetical protein
MVNLLPYLELRGMVARQEQQIKWPLSSKTSISDQAIKLISLLDDSAVFTNNEHN